MSNSRDPDRLVLFADAVVAIAITLLVLPLVDLVTAAEAGHEASPEIITKHWPQIESFLLSFVVIARMWLTHHRMFERVQAYSRALMLWNLVWVFTIVVLPFSTEMVGAYSNDQFTTTFYVGTILASSACQTVLTLIIYHNPELAVEDDKPTMRNVVGAATATSLLVVALLLTALVPNVSYYALLLLLLTPLVIRLWARLSSTSDAAKAA